MKSFNRITGIILMGALGGFAVGCKSATQSTDQAPISQSASQDITRRTTERRAVEAVIWGIPVVNYDRMFQAMVNAAHGGTNQILYWTHPSDWKNQTLTPNTDALYLMPFFNTKDAGPIVVEIPPAGPNGSIVGTLMDCWQTPLEDVGPAGVDKGKGGKYLILPPDYKQKPPAGYISLPSSNNQGYGLLRSIPKSGSEADIAAAVAYGRQVKLYPLSAAAHPPATTFADGTNVIIDGTIPYDTRFFESLNRMVQTEPWLTRDKAMIDQLRSIGIEKGKDFHPDDASTAALKSAVAEAHEWFEHRYAEYPPYNSGAHWFFPADPAMMQDMATAFANPDRYPVDARGLIYTYVFTSVKHMGAGQFYLFGNKDKGGRPLDGAKTYHLAVPAHVPAHQYWSATAYDYATHALIREVPYGSRSSLTPGIKINPDGSADLYFGPKAPEGKEFNWIPTKGGQNFELIFRLYGPDKALFDKTWVLPDLEEMK